MALLTLDDLESFVDIDEDKADQMIADASSLAVLAAPCLAEEDDLTEVQLGAIKAILRGAILRWIDSGSGAFTQQTTGPFSVSIDTRQRRTGMFWPSEIVQLQAICKGETGGAFSVDTAGPDLTSHAEVCALRFGALYCSCGADITLGLPLYELP